MNKLLKMGNTTTRKKAATGVREPSKAAAARSRAAARREALQKVTRQRTLHTHFVQF